MSDTILEVRNICKDFPGVRALEDVSFDLKRGEVHILLGENGAGKSTLMKVLTGVYHPEKGEIFLNGKEVRFETPRDAQLMRIAIIFQEFNLAPNLTVAQNIYLGREPLKRGGLIDRQKLNRDARAILDFLKADIDPSARVEALGVAHQQLVEVAKALSIDSEILIMDEPTATLSEKEINTLFDTIRSLQSRGVSIIYISHRLQEVKLIGNRITVLRDGRTVGTRDAANAELDDLIRMMVGREIKRRRIREKNTARDGFALEVSHLSQGKLLKDISLNVRRGEIVGLAGLVGSGRTELAQAVYGVTRRDAGEVSICGKPVANPTPMKCIRQKMGFISESRKEFGLALNLPIRVNITHAGLRTIFPSGIVDVKKERKIAEEFRKKLRMATPDVERDVKALSGGTQQKVVLAKWLSTDSEFLVFDEPTRGIDVGAKEEIHNMIVDLAERGVGILMISSDLPEVLTLSDRIYVMREGRIVREIDHEGVMQEEVIAYATGGAAT
ncbi:MAG: sugar ABC transporter ATP-binding protein [Clostridiales bacterium]|nr:sugar ABC transporter ATP-binding protein [Clostridiales bacterium]OPZ69035.1 MAG: Galactose/methyl galactoside import ATP-binding protein MglA [Firmicutes bacterium ADurb.Bin467]